MNYKIFDRKEDINKGDIVELTKKGCAIPINTKPTFEKISRINSSVWTRGMCSVTDLDGNIYIIGSFVNSAFSNNILLNTENNNAGIFIAQLGADGEWKWAQKIFEYTSGTNHSDLSFDIIYHKGQLYGAGIIHADVTLSVVNNIFILTNPINDFRSLEEETSSSNAFIINFNQGGIIEYLTIFSGNLSSQIRLSIDGKKNVYFVNGYSGRLVINDMLALPCIMNKNIQQLNTNGYVAKLNKKGEFEWLNEVSLPDDVDNASTFADIVTTKKGTSYIVGSFLGRICIGHKIIKCYNDCYDSCGTYTNEYTNDYSDNISNKYSDNFDTDSDYSEYTKSCREFTEKSECSNNYSTNNLTNYSDSYTHNFRDSRYTKQYCSDSYITNETDFVEEEEDETIPPCFLLLEINKCGEWIQEQHFRTGEGMGIDLDSCNNLIISGYLYDTYEMKDKHHKMCDEKLRLFVAKLDLCFETEWLFSFRFKDDNINRLSANLVIDEWNNIYVDGPFGDAIKIGTDVLCPKDVVDKFIFKLTTNGQFEWTSQLSGLRDYYGKEVSVDPFGNVYVATSFFNPLLVNCEMVANTYVETLGVIKISQSFPTLIGVVTEIIDENKVKVVFSGIAGCFENLCTSKDYYIDLEGCLTLDNGFRYIGTAVSTSELFLK